MREGGVGEGFDFDSGDVGKLGGVEVGADVGIFGLGGVVRGEDGVVGLSGEGTA